jgi:hypothetical protein
VGGRAHTNRQRRCEGVCGGCCAKAERGRNGERGSDSARAKREGGPVHVTRRNTGPGGWQLRRRGGQSGTYRAKQGKSWAHGPRLLWGWPNRNSAIS